MRPSHDALAQPTPKSPAPGQQTDAERQGGQDAGRRQRPHPVREFFLVAALFTAYKLARAAVDDRVSTAFHNAHSVWDFERAIRLPGESAVQAAILGNDLLVHAANVYYAYVHFPATAVFLLWMYRRRPAQYRWARRALAVLTASAFVLHALVPLAPPRLLGGTGMIDTGAVFGPAVYGPPQTDTLANQYAAMPSLHVGWALMVAVGVIATTRRWWRWCWLLHPLATLIVVVGTANHYWLDAIVVAALLAVTLLCLVPSYSAASALLPPPTADRGAGRARPRERALTGATVEITATPGGVSEPSGSLR
jgi:hypothetical protein